MKIIKYRQIVDTVKTMCIDAASKLPGDVMERIRDACACEPFPRAQTILDRIVDNAITAEKHGIPICQDTGFAVFFVKVGMNVTVDGGSLYDAINQGTQEGYAEGHLRCSIVNDPIFDRINTGNNTPAIIHVDLTDGSDIEITLMPKGGGCENMGALAMLKPADGVDGIIKFVRDTVASAGGNPCPPLVIGVGVGGTADAAGLLAKKALLRPAGLHNPDSRYAKLEENLKKAINGSGVGPQGFGGLHTTLWVSVEYMPCHIASMPVAISINCHAARRAYAVLEGS